MHCPRCGKNYESLHSTLCLSCLLEELKPVSLPEKIEMQVCADCGAVLLGKHWEKLGSEKAGAVSLISQHLKCTHGFKCEEIEVEMEEIDRDVFLTNIVLSLAYEGERITWSKKITLFRRRGLCPACSRLHGHGFSAIIQIRRKGRAIGRDVLEEIEGILREKSGGKQEIVKREKVQNGIDLYIVDNAYARTVCALLKQRFKARVKISPRLHTRKEGREVYRVTYLVELDRFEEGDLIYYEGRLYLASEVEQGKVVLRTLQGEERRLQQEVLKNLEIIEIEMLEEMKVVYCTPEEISVLDEKTMRLEKFENIDYPEDAQNAWVLKREDNIYLVPLRSVKKMRGEAR